MAFILSYALSGDFFLSIEVIMFVTVISLATAYLLQRRLAIFPTLTASMVLIFGALSLDSQNESFFIFLDTLSNAIFGVILGISLWLDKPVLKPMFKHIFAVNDLGWYYLTLRWAILFSSIAILNELVRLFGTPEQWVYFKTANIIFTVIFGLWQFRLSSRYRIPRESNRLGLRLVEK